MNNETGHDEFPNFRADRRRRLHRAAAPAAIKDTGGDLVAALDPTDSVGIIDSYFPQARFFTEFERFDRHVDKLRPRGRTDRLRVSICSPNYLHDAHVRFALRAGADAICEKPLVLNPWNIDGLAEIERETGRSVNTILQLRLHPAIIDAARAHRGELERQDPRRRPDLHHLARPLVLRVVEGRRKQVGRHRHQHRRPLLRHARLHVFGPAEAERRASPARRTARPAISNTRRARVRWFLSIDARDLPRRRAGQEDDALARSRSTARRSSSPKASPTCTRRATRRILAGSGFGLDEVRPSIEIVSPFARRRR